jgi:hypothetical protein
LTAVGIVGGIGVEGGLLGGEGAALRRTLRGWCGGRLSVWKWVWCVQNLMKGEPLKLVEGGKSQRTFIYIKDAIDVVQRMIVSPPFSWPGMDWTSSELEHVVAVSGWLSGVYSVWGDR